MSGKDAALEAPEGKGRRTRGPGGERTPHSGPRQGKGRRTRGPGGGGGVTAEAAHGPRRSASGRAAPGRVPAVGRRDAASRASSGRPGPRPRRPPRLAPDSGLSFAPRLSLCPPPAPLRPPPRPTLQDGAAAGTGHVSSGPGQCWARNCRSSCVGFSTAGITDICDCIWLVAIRLYIVSKQRKIGPGEMPRGCELLLLFSRTQGAEQMGSILLTFFTSLVKPEVPFILPPSFRCLVCGGTEFNYRRSSGFKMELHHEE
ncbi:translation initiation factor IF-2-like [Mesocricetus auratus]|uniref:Translation initiation factor IF-2-like n=1 Tax=Mesocricetus auratus TaxID=10036 RepID=A0ABM2WKP3_MESAU|nr:translation initiation factor IF-2-like [Mesocricetus auratus]